MAYSRSPTARVSQNPTRRGKFSCLESFCERRVVGIDHGYQGTRTTRTLLGCGKYVLHPSRASSPSCAIQKRRYRSAPSTRRYGGPSLNIRLCGQTQTNSTANASNAALRPMRQKAYGWESVENSSCVIGSVRSWVRIHSTSTGSASPHQTACKAGRASSRRSSLAGASHRPRYPNAFGSAGHRTTWPDHAARHATVFADLSGQACHPRPTGKRDASGC
ncbi:hypothetical protein DOCECA_07625 [Pseudomonas sp. E102]